MYKVGIDAMGGDYAPEAVVKGALLAKSEIGIDCNIVLFGDKAKIEAIFEQEGYSRDAIEIVHTTEVIDFNDHPAQAFVKKPDSSIAVGYNHLASGKIDGFASAGSTGAMMVGCMFAVKQIDGVIRPTISSFVPGHDGSRAIILDVGLNLDCKPDVLLQYALIGDVYARIVLKKENPRVALLNVGSESEKGNLVSKETYKLISEVEDLNFIGNVEGHDILAGKADVIVCDGFVGNVVLKMAESFYEIGEKKGYPEDSFLNGLNYEVVGGTPVLGVNAPVVIGHGSSSPLAIKNMILQTEICIKSELTEKLKEKFNK